MTENNTERDPMFMPAWLARELLWYECAVCHKEVERRDLLRQICPHCKVGNSVMSRYQGKPGAWTAYLRWLEDGRGAREK